MNEREQNRLIRGLIRQRDAWKAQETGHKDKASGRAERITATRLNDRRPRGYGMFPQSLMRQRTGGGVS
ncbi:hypothetical protein EC12264_1359, partial [Escherichia coli 1.2264]